jgi:pyruvate formate lyase activating enzyme
VEVLPYHTLGVYKYKQLGIAYPLEGVSPPDKQLLETVKNVLGAN